MTHMITYNYSNVRCTDHAANTHQWWHRNNWTQNL